MGQSITIRMLKTLERGCASLGEQARRLVVEYLLSQRSHRSAYVNKQGEEDLYYTSFGWLLEAALGVEQYATAMESYLAEFDEQELDLVHYAAFLRCALMQRAATGRLAFMWSAIKRRQIRPLESFKIVPNNDRRSPYTQFVWCSLCEDTGNEFTLFALDDYRTAEGGYANLRGGRQVATNATAAALMVLGQSEGYVSQRAETLSLMQHESGGFRASEMAPVPDLLSTATALFVLDCYGLKPRYEATDFVEAHWLENGGFAATLLDERSDVEYLFYGLLALGTL